MNGQNLDPALVLAGVCALVVVAWAWRVSARRARAAKDATRAGARPVSLTGRVVVGAIVLAGAQWLAVTYPGLHWSMRVVALLLPAVFASWSLVKALTVTTVDGRRGDRR